MERSLVERAQAGDRDAFEMLVRQKVDAVYRTAYAILGSEADAQDATQETFIAAWRSLPRLREPNKFPAWLARITTNACRMSLRHRRSVREIPMRPDDQASGASYAPPDGSVAEAQAFDRAFERLPVEQRALLVAHHLGGTFARDVRASPCSLGPGRCAIVELVTDEFVDPPLHVADVIVDIGRAQVDREIPVPRSPLATTPPPP